MISPVWKPQLKEPIITKSSMWVHYLVSLRKSNSSLICIGQKTKKSVPQEPVIKHHHHKWIFSLYQNFGKQKPMPQNPLITPSIITQISSNLINCRGGVWSKQQRPQPSIPHPLCLKSRSEMEKQQRPQTSIAHLLWLQSRSEMGKDMQSDGKCHKWRWNVL